jgi:hypothetical protein
MIGACTHDQRAPFAIPVLIVATTPAAVTEYSTVPPAATSNVGDRAANRPVNVVPTVASVWIPSRFLSAPLTVETKLRESRASSSLSAYGPASTLIPPWKSALLTRSPLIGSVGQR